MPLWFYWKYCRDEFKLLSRSLWTTCSRELGSFYEFVCEVYKQPYKPIKSCESCVTCAGHYCPYHASRSTTTSNGGKPGYDANGSVNGNPSTTSTVSIVNRIPIPKPNEYGNFSCPISGLSCGIDACKEFCAESSSVNTKA
jgi:hypothetical protein